MIIILLFIIYFEIVISNNIPIVFDFSKINTLQSNMSDTTTKILNLNFSEFMFRLKSDKGKTLYSSYMSLDTFKTIFESDINKDYLNINSLSIKYMDDIPEWLDINDLSLPKEFYILKNLKKIEIIDCPWFKSLNSISDYFQNLEVLILEDLKNLDDDSLKAIANLKNITHLEIKGCKIKKIPKEILINCVNLEILYLTDNLLTQQLDVSKLTNLLVLDINKNKIDDILGLDEIFNLEKLGFMKLYFENIRFFKDRHIEIIWEDD